MGFASSAFISGIQLFIPRRHCFRCSMSCCLNCFPNCCSRSCSKSCSRNCLQTCCGPDGEVVHFLVSLLEGERLRVAGLLVLVDFHPAPPAPSEKKAARRHSSTQCSPSSETIMQIINYALICRAKLHLTLVFFSSEGF